MMTNARKTNGIFVVVEEVRSRKDVKWSDLVDEADSRTPGRVVHVHEKLSSPSRKR